ncbi:FISUMP domain-containing protein [Fibrobacter sp. UWH1]|uniref:FISUMP domain-containing protein n=1 Tax=Fibrobacter sp. UWH1 TaxID=1964354 RepID=UPI000B51FAB5|nr:FISUMP domain-containing protein [Fibrobacter sp. UWH1]OWV16572.1 hypothetical protein B7992_02325 [Fibrobacter sp. UWH1]
MKKGMIKQLSASLLTGATMFMSSAFMAGCSESGDAVGHGGVEEETSIAQGTLRLAGSVQVMAKMVISDLENFGSTTKAISFEAHNVEFCVLDSATFAVSEECFRATVGDQRNYDLKLDNKSWRYGLVTVNGSWLDEPVSYRAVVDAKKSLATNVNILTEWEYYLADKFVASGASVEDALAQARRSVLDTMGLGEGYDDFGKMNLAGASKSDAALVAATFALKLPSEEQSIEYLVDVAMSAKFFHSDPFWEWLGVDRPDESFMSLADKYMSNFASVFLNLGRCEGENLGRLIRYNEFDFGFLDRSVKEFGYSLKCEDGLWFWVAPEYEHQVGTMTDARDGRTYMTTTFSIDGKSVTWMAEDLQYNVSGSRCFGDVPENCDSYGRLYSWLDLMDLDTTGYMETAVYESGKPTIQRFNSLEECMEKEMTDGNLEWIGLDSTGAYLACMDQQVQYSKVLESIDPRNHQGICPDGWRIPSVKDWNALSEFLGDNMDVKLMKDDAWPIMVAAEESAIGFMFARSMDVVDFSATPNGAQHEKYFAIIPGADEDNQFGLNGNYVEIDRGAQAVDIYGAFDPGYYNLLSVRCIKAD